MNPVTFNTTAASADVSIQDVSKTSIIDLVISSTATVPTVGNARDFNEQTFYLRIPTIVFLSILVPIGIFGNATVICIFGFYTKRSNVQFFVVILAFFDIITCLIGVPLELTELFYMHTYPSDGLCKIQRLVNYTCSVGSALVLLSISIERYTKVCRPHGRQMTPGLCKALALVILIVSVPFAAPVAISYDRHPVMVDGNITVQQCAFHESPRAFAYYACLLPACVAIFITMLVLYSCVLRSAVLHFRRQAKKRTTKSGPERMISHTSTTVICLTVLYVLAFTPTLIIGIITKNYAKVDFTSTLQIAMIFLYRSWVINSSVNPIIYGFFNKAYRNTFLKLLSTILCLTLPKRQSKKPRGRLTSVDKDFASVDRDCISTSAMDFTIESVVDKGPAPTSAISTCTHL